MDFKSFWLEASKKEDFKNKLIAVFEAMGFLLFFTCKDEIFGCGEQGRLVFARIKNPNKEDIKGWDNDASFAAFNLSKLIKGENTKAVFGKKDLDHIQVIPLEDVIKELTKGNKTQELKLPNDEFTNIY